MALRQPATAILTVTLLAAANANAASQADCEQLRQQLVGQYGVLLRYDGGISVVGQRCRELNAKLVPDQTALAQCNASLQNLQASWQQANSAYYQASANYDAVCTTTATYGPQGAPGYAKDTTTELPNGKPGYTTDSGSVAPYSPYQDMPSASQPTQTFQNPTDQDTQNIVDFATPDMQQGIGLLLGGFGGGRSGGSRGGGLKHC